MSVSSLPPAVVVVLLYCLEERDFVLLTSRAEACATALGGGCLFM